MGIPAVFTWPAASATSVASLQTFGAAGSLALDGSLTLPARENSTSRIAYFPNIFRKVSLTSTNNLSAVNFIITGIGLSGSSISETIAGPNSNTVESVNLFQTVTSITFNAAVTAVSAGTGQSGQTGWFTYDIYTDNANLGIGIVITGTINYTMQVTFEDLNKNPNTSPVVFTPVTAMTAATTNQITNLIQPIRFSNVKINSSTGAATLVATYIQQGLTD